MLATYLVTSGTAGCLSGCLCDFLISNWQKRRRKGWRDEKRRNTQTKAMDTAESSSLTNLNTGPLTTATLQPSRPIETAVMITAQGKLLTNLNSAFPGEGPVTATVLESSRPTPTDHLRIQQKLQADLSNGFQDGSLQESLSSAKEKEKVHSQFLLLNSGTLGDALNSSQEWVEVKHILEARAAERFIDETPCASSPTSQVFFSESKASGPLQVRQPQSEPQPQKWVRILPKCLLVGDIGSRFLVFMCEI
eukprot:gnl/MRDRNA2_/MRDRNA2_82567_c0_seq1.p1 gnl/MRDRNA2_/MRDRNA2_82567_c0~~gnl/MRDRNA2_/MRDRNA2_82567_c0_seq1.p1  ORF type:complete len:270 (-),score=36.60 gnl/MRDRNA2_/MRDRNA2_82567_c0_seq1:109-858(-)